MASHFSSIGLKVTEKKDFIDYFNQAYQNGEKIRSRLGTYVKWNIGNGVELWGQIDKINNPIGMTPHFTGSSKMRVKIEKRIKRNEDTVLDGALYCWADSQKLYEDDGAYPFVFDLPDINTCGDINIPQSVTAQVTGFAHEITAYKNEEEYNKSQSNELKVASKSFFPVGLFNQNETSEESPQAMAIFTGHVVESCKLKNTITKMEFIWAKVNTLGGEFDIVVDPKILEGDIYEGEVVSGMFWLSGRIVGKYNKKEKKKRKFSLFNFFNKN